MNPETMQAEAVAADPPHVDSECSPMQDEPYVACGVWTRDVEALCRALDAQQRAHFPRLVAEERNTGGLKAKGKSR